MSDEMQTEYSRPAYKRPGWNAFLTSGFDRSRYGETLPVGEWEAVIEKSAWPKRAPGIHLYLLNCSDGQRYWFFVPWARHELYELFRTLPDGSRIRLCVREGKDPTKPRVESVELLVRARGQ